MGYYECRDLKHMQSARRDLFKEITVAVSKDDLLRSPKSARLGRTEDQQQCIVYAKERWCASHAIQLQH